jgi:hypothetical protein
MQSLHRTLARRPDLIEAARQRGGLDSRDEAELKKADEVSAAARAAIDKAAGGKD